MSDYYTPTARQRLFHSCPADIILYGGAAGGGKSEALLWEGFLQMIETPGNRGLLLRRTFPELNRSLIVRSLQKFPRDICRYHATDKAWIFNNGSILEFGYCEKESDVYNYQCFHPDTEILTEDGWRYVKDVKVGDLVATLDPETRVMTYKPVTKTWAYDFDGELVTLFQRKGAAFAVTPNHTIWASTDRIKKLRPYRADELPNVAKIPQWAKWVGIEPDSDVVSFKSDGNNGREIALSLDVWLRFLGLWIAEGDTYEDRWAVRIHQAKEDGKEYVRSLLDQMGVNYWEQKACFSFTSKAMVKYLRSECGTHSNYKRVPKEVKRLAPRFLQLLLEGLMFGDGTWYNGKRRGIFVTSSKQLADDVCEIALKCGYVVTTDFRNDNPPDSPYGTKPRWRVYLHRKNNDTSVRSADGHQSKSQVTKERYRGPVYCVTVPPYHTVLIRYKGRVSWSGQSAEYGFIGFDELTHFTYAQWDYLVNSRLRAVMPGAWPRVRAASNPGNVGHAWVKAMFVDKGLRDVVWENSRGIKFAFIPAKVEDNPYILKYDPGYIERMNMLDPKWRAALRDGNWDTFAGQFFDTWDPLHHVLDEHFEPPRHWPRFRALDWGFSKPYSVGWYAVTPTGALYRYRELYGYGGSPNQGSRETAEEVARRIAEIEAEAGERDLIGPADNQIWNSGKDAGKSVAEWFQDYGITWIPASKNRLNGWNEFRSRLQLDYDENGRPQPRFFVSPRCEHFIRTIPTLVHSESKPEDLDTDGEDHCADEARYAFMYWREHGDNQAVNPIRNDLEDYYNVLVTPSGEPIYLPKGESTSGEWWE